MKKIVWALIIVMLSPLAGLAQDENTPNVASKREVRRTEMLFALPPSEWVASQQSPDGAIYQPVREGAWVDRMEVKIHRNSRTPAKNLSDKIQLTTRSDCGNYQSPGPRVGVSQGYETLFLVEECGSPAAAPKMAPGQPEPLIVNMHKLIRGQDHLYQISRVWRGYRGEKGNPLTDPDAAVTWESLLEKVEVCDLRKPGVYCQSLGLADAATGAQIAAAAGWPKNHGCSFLAVATLLPDLSLPIEPVRFVGLTFGDQLFGEAPDQQELLKQLSAAAARNQPVGLVTRVVHSGSTSLEEDIIVNDQNLGVLFDFFVSKGLADNRWLVRRFYDCSHG